MRINTIYSITVKAGLMTAISHHCFLPEDRNKTKFLRPSLK